MQYFAAVHHDDPVAEVDGLLHGVGDHERGEFVALDDFVADADDLIGALRIQRGRVFVQQQ